MFRRAAGCAQVAAQGEAVLARHHDVEYDEVDAVLLQRRSSSFAACSLPWCSAAPAEIIGEQPVANVTIVIDDQDVVLLAHCRLS